jgi:hypothetical protein
VGDQADPLWLRVGVEFERTALDGLQQWQKKAAPDLERRALQALNRHVQERPAFESCIKSEYVVKRSVMADAPSAFATLFAQSKAAPSIQAANQMIVLAWRAPWEQMREIRLLKLVYAGQLRALKTPPWLLHALAESRLRAVKGRDGRSRGSSNPAPSDLLRAEDWVAPTEDLAKSFSRNKLNDLLSLNRFQPLLMASTGLRMSDASMRYKVEEIRIRFALGLYKAEKGSPAKSLKDLVPKYLPEVPVNPLDGSSTRFEDMLEDQSVQPAPSRQNAVVAGPGHRRTATTADSASPPDNARPAR